MSTIAFIGDPSIAFPLQIALESNASWGISVRQHSNVARFIEADYRPDAMLITDITSDATRDVLNLIASMVIERIPTTVIAYHSSTPALINEGWGKIEEWTRNMNQERVEAIRSRGEEPAPWMLTNPADTTDVCIAPYQLGIVGVIQELAPSLGISAEQIASLPAVLRNPLPSPMASSTSLMGEKATGGRLFAFTSDKGGCGKTSTAIMFGSGIAYHSALNGSPKSVVVVDIDRQSQMRSHFLDADPRKNVTVLKENSTPEDIRNAVIQFTDSSGTPYPGLYALLGGDNNSNEHLAFRSRELYGHVIPILRDMFDVVILDCSVGVLKDEVTSWAVQEADVTYYTLDQLRESFDMAVAVRDGAIAPVSEGGLGLSPDRFRVIVTKERLKSGHHHEWWNANVHNEFTVNGTTVEGTIPFTLDVDEAKDDCALVEVVQTSDSLAGPIQMLAHKTFPMIVPKSGGAHPQAAEKKRGFLGR